jgi:hypothetical protein
MIKFTNFTKFPIFLTIALNDMDLERGERGESDGRQSWEINQEESLTWFAYSSLKLPTAKRNKFSVPLRLHPKA